MGTMDNENRLDHEFLFSMFRVLEGNSWFGVLFLALGLAH